MISSGVLSSWASAVSGVIFVYVRPPQLRPKNSSSTSSHSAYPAPRSSAHRRGDESRGQIFLIRIAAESTAAGASVGDRRHAGAREIGGVHAEYASEHLDDPCGDARCVELASFHVTEAAARSCRGRGRRGRRRQHRRATSRSDKPACARSRGSSVGQALASAGERVSCSLDSWGVQELVDRLLVEARRRRESKERADMIRPGRRARLRRLGSGSPRPRGVGPRSTLR